MEIKEAETLEKKEEGEKLTEEKQDDDDCDDDEEMEGEEEEESHAKSQNNSDGEDAFIEMEMDSEEMREERKRKHQVKEEYEELKSDDVLTNMMEMDDEEEEDEKEEEEETNGRFSSSPFHLPSILNVIHDFRYPTVRRGEKEGEEVVLLQDGRPMDTRPLHLRGESSSGGGSVGVDECGRVFTELSGLITSPNFPFNYPNNAQCAYYISLPSQYTIALDCNDFSIQPGDKNCENDYLLITEDGQVDGEGVTRYCGDKALSLFTSSSNMTLLFVADSSYRYRGFTCRYRAINPDGTGAVPAVITNTTEEHHTVLCTGPGNDGWSGKCGVDGGPGATRVVGRPSSGKAPIPVDGKAGRGLLLLQVAVLKVCGREEQHYCNICGGTVISRRWVLTGAHCVVSIPVEKLGLLLGDHNLYTLTPSQKFFLVAAVYIHPDFNMPSPLNNDLALAFLPQEMAFNTVHAQKYTNDDTITTTINNNSNQTAHMFSTQPPTQRGTTTRTTTIITNSPHLQFSATHANKATWRPSACRPRDYDALSQLLPDAAPQEASTTTNTPTTAPTTAPPSRRNGKLFSGGGVIKARRDTRALRVDA
ncbi:hypothetical protein O3P69_020093 [Scylla paramamosain]|uniref:CUB domain-containing protein n=1 Tax=Scylla paramamosain TaxID=85552 RepID=A0AAW0TJQ2_SCYPA